MSKTVFILGAGASAETGAPVMRDFLDKAEDLRSSPRLKDARDKEAFDLVFKGIYGLQSVFAKSWMDPDNLESVFVAFEMAKLLGRLDELCVDEIEKLPEMLRWVIVRTLEETVLYPVKDGRIQPHPGYDLLARYLKDNKDASIITFNYDCALRPVHQPLSFHWRETREA